MTDEEVLEIMIENETLKKALSSIANFDASSRNGSLDEWEEAWAFNECQKIAQAALESNYNTAPPN